MITKKELEQVQETIQLIENNINSSYEIKIKNSYLEEESSRNNKNYEIKSKDYNGEKTKGFRKQEEFGPKKFIKP